MDKKKATKSIVKTNPEVGLQEELPNIGSRGWLPKRKEPKRPFVHPQP